MTPDALITFGFAWICLGILLGAPMALAFLRQDWLGGYGSLDRRLLRLSHVAFLMLSLLSIVYGYAFKTGSLETSCETLSLWGILVGAIVLPILLLAGIWRKRVLWLLPAPFLSIFVAMVSAAVGRFA